MPGFNFADYEQLTTQLASLTICMPNPEAHRAIDEGLKQRGYRGKEFVALRPLVWRKRQELKKAHPSAPESAQQSAEVDEVPVDEMNWQTVRDELKRRRKHIQNPWLVTLRELEYRPPNKGELEPLRQLLKYLKGQAKVPPSAIGFASEGQSWGLRSIWG